MNREETWTKTIPLLFMVWTDTVLVMQKEEEEVEAYHQGRLCFGYLDMRV